MVDMENQNRIIFVIFGVTGDLTRRKLVPALYELVLADKLPEPFTIVGFARREWSDDYMVETLMEGLRTNFRRAPVDQDFSRKLFNNALYIQSEFQEEDGYKRLGEYLERVKAENVIFYLATPPDSYLEIIRNIDKFKLKTIPNGWVRIVIEKPYGKDLKSADELEYEVHKAFRERQIYRIDHYLGKETVQNILVLRFANGIFEPLWDRRYVDHVQITVAETHGVGTRAGYYEGAGVIRDMFQNHLLQLLTLTAMEAPVSFNADAVRDEKVKVLNSLRPMIGQKAIKNTYRAQYSSGLVEGARIPGYKDVDGVSPESTTETYLAARLFVDNWRWAGVPFFLRSGKSLPARLTQIAINFRQAPLSLFDWQNVAGEAPNVLVLNLQPNEGITLTFGAKLPGPGNQIAPVKMDFSYLSSFGDEPPEAYMRLLLDCLTGDATLFTRSDEVLAQWKFTNDILDAWANHPIKNLPVYEAGTWGPEGADTFIAEDGKKWRNEIS